MNKPGLIYKKQWDEYFNRGYELLEENILKLNESTAEQKSKLVVVIIPTEIQIYDWMWNEYMKEYSLDESEYDRYKVINLLSDFLKENKIRYINLLSSFKKLLKLI